jgi:hypothetical protein
MQRRGLRDHDQHQSKDRDGDVHPEDRPPSPLGEIAAEDRTDRRKAPGDAKEHRQSSPPLAQGERLHHDRQGRRKNDRPTDALDHPERDNPRLGQAPLTAKIIAARTRLRDLPPGAPVTVTPLMPASASVSAPALPPVHTVEGRGGDR